MLSSIQIILLAISTLFVIISRAAFSFNSFSVNCQVPFHKPKCNRLISYNDREMWEGILGISLSLRVTSDLSMNLYQ